MLRVVSIMISLTLMACGAEEGTKGTQTGEACAQSDALEQCPPNTEPTLEADAESKCSSEGSVSIEADGTAMEGSGSGAISQVCVGTGSCRVVCTLAEPCEFGVESVSAADGIVCQAAPCGNGVCDSGENPENCVVDCGGSACGNGECQAGEDPTSCPQDCSSACGDGTCDAGEDPTACPQDCSSACGNGECESGEDPETCPQDCSGAVCTDGATRCSGADLQRCNQLGEWETTACQMDQACVEVDGSATCSANAVDCIAACGTLLTECVQDSAICEEVNREAYDAYCISRCVQYNERFEDYLEDPTDCRRALDLSLIRDGDQDGVPFCVSSECDAACQCDSACRELWNRCINPEGHSANETQCAGAMLEDHNAACPAQCMSMRGDFESYLANPDMCAQSFTSSLFECGPPECGNGICEYGETRGTAPAAGLMQCQMDCR
jgi:hypothetical protein